MSQWRIKKFFLKKNKAQVSIEFTFCMIIILFMIYATIKIFAWSGMDLVKRRQTHDNSLIQPVVNPSSQIDPDFYGSHKKINAVWSGK